MAKILVVEDSKFQCKRIVEALEDSYEVICSNNGNQALKVLESETPDCIFSDLVMPELDGFGLLEKLKELNCQIPTIMLTSDTQDITRDKCLELGAKDVLSKPFQKDKLFEAIQSALK